MLQFQLTNFKRSFRSLGSSVSSVLTAFTSFFIAVAAGILYALNTETEFDSLFNVVVEVEVELEMGSRVGATGGGDVKVFGTILYFFFFGKSPLAEPSGGDSIELLGLMFSSPLRLRLCIVTCGELSAETLLKSMLYGKK